MTALLYLLSFLSGAAAGVVASLLMGCRRRRLRENGDDYGFMAVVRY